MQIFSDNIDLDISTDELELFASKDDFLYLDIETTGLSPEAEKIYLIGCMYHRKDGWKLTQWFDDDGNGEADLLTSFQVFSTRYKILVHFNGSRFDIPFLQKRFAANRLADPFSGKKSLDLYKVIRPYKKILALPGYGQQAVEEFFRTGRTEAHTGGELVKVYKDYLEAPDNEKLWMLLYHNSSDVRGLLSITKVLSLSDLFASRLKVRKAQINYFRDLNGERKQELILTAVAADANADTLPSPVASMADGCCLNMQGNRITIKVPVYSDELKYFYANYKDYYYLPAEDQAMHKSIATFVDKEHRKQATARTCYTRKSGTFLPEWDLFRSPFFKHDFDDDSLYFELSDAMKNDRVFFSDYAEYVFRHITGLKTGESSSETESTSASGAAEQTEE